MALISKPDYTYIWASGGSVVEPSDTKKQTGWTAEVPPFQWENWIQNRQDQFIAHINQRGIPQWDGQTEYEAGGLSYVQGTDGIVYKSVAASGPSTTSQDPTTDVSDTYWTVAFADVGAFLTQAAGDARYLQIANDLSDLNSSATARNNLGVYSKTEVDTRNLNSTRIDVPSTANINLTTLAPNTNHINITGTTTINGFTVAAGKCYFVRFAGTLSLVNSASLVTNSGADITTAAGDTCTIRATAANTVEILAFTPGDNYTIIYPNGGSAGSPATVVANTRYVESNPFPGHVVTCVAEVQIDGQWGDPGEFSSSASTAYGVKASQLNDDSIIVRTLLNGIHQNPSLSGSPFPISAVTTSAPCRVKVWRA